ncbi:phospholipase D/nuclease [Pholiota conissans]|uniref:Phospholipase D/nuclease n=1 Tax=Pholiota conissans TaxID=109636 RepID=A0A9P5Z5K5_9AGAR|nr:phospholipase D/nuclease [Pholiota conissans]
MSTEDEDLARAIALSLQETSRKPPIVINVDSDEEDDVEEVKFQGELRKAIQASKFESSQHNADSSSVSGTSQPSVDRSQVGTQPSAFLSERAQLEKQRVERLKRLRPEQPRPSSPETNDSENEEPPAKRHQISTSNSSFSRSNVPSVNSSDSVPTIEQVFWKAELRQTATQHAEPRKDGQPTFRLTEVLGKKSDLAFAILSSYALDLPWIYQFFDHTVPVIMVAQPDASGEATIKNVLPNWIRSTPFLRAGRGCQHMKLFYKNGRLRVVVSTANLISYDWRNMENTVWLQDIPLRVKPIPHDPKSPDDFAAAFQRVLYAVNVRPALHPNLPLKAIEELRQKWDWSNVKVQLVSSIAGKHEGWPSVIQTGHPRLMSVVRKLGMRTGEGSHAKDLILECQGSSIGIYTTQWFNEFHWSARGESAESWLDRSKKSRESKPYPPIKIVFPRKVTVQQSAAGEKGGGTIFCRRKQWAVKNFPRTHFYDSKSKGGPVLMHSKMIIAMLQEHQSGNQRRDRQRNQDDSSDDDIQVIEPALGWAYVGSHNFTPSAWGTMSGSSFNPILNISNYELGIVFLLKDKDEMDRVACFQRPPEKYTYKDEPWIQEESAYH